MQFQKLYSRLIAGGAFLFAGLLVMGIGFQPINAKAQSLNKVAVGERYFDHASRTWKTKKRSSGVSRRSNRSPIKRKTVYINTPHKPGTIIINTKERRLYLIENGTSTFNKAKRKAIKYGIGVGKTGFTWSGTHRITRKAEWPGWTPPARMRAREAKKGKILPAYMKGGPNNPLGARALYIGSTIYRIHGTSEPWSIGGAVSSGCIRLANDDVIDLYKRVRIGAKVIVQ